MSPGRLEAFSDGVIAILITIMVLELRPPEGDSITGLIQLTPIFLSYILSFVFLGIYWNNHHHLLHAAKRVDGKVLWANLHLLFWLSLIPFVTAWMGENAFTAWPVALYGLVMLFSGIAYYILSQVLIALHGKDSPLAIAVGRDLKGILSIVLYFAAIAVAFFRPWIACALYVIVAILWFIPDQRIEKTIAAE
jgi:uncharacterized membrane protein